jgi:hypothetical protein
MYATVHARVRFHVCVRVCVYVNVDVLSTSIDKDTGMDMHTYTGTDPGISTWALKDLDTDIG